MILVDSNILIDVIADDPVWKSWSLDRLAEAAETGGAAANQMVVAEVAPRFGSVGAFRREIEPLGVTLHAFGDDAAYQAGKAFIAYRRNRGPGAPALPLPDFFIGAHALIEGIAVLTRDPRFYRRYFPTIPLITPEHD